MFNLINNYIRNIVFKCLLNYFSLSISYTYNILQLFSVIYNIKAVCVKAAMYMLRSALRSCGGGCRWSDHASLLSVWRYSQHGCPHGVQWKRYVLSVSTSTKK